MNGRIRSSQVLQSLRIKAEELVRRQGEAAGLSADKETDLMILSHELEVQYVELELQNEELRNTARELEASRNDFAELYQNAPVGFVTLDKNGVIVHSNTSASRILCSSDQLLTGQVFLLLLHPEDRDVFQAFLNSTSPRGINAPLDLRLKPHLGITPQLQVQATVKCDSAGECRFQLSMVDITARKHYEDALSRARDLLEKRVQERTAELEQRMRELARLTSELTLAEQRERRRLAEVLHDNLQQLLAGSRYNLDLLGQAHGLADEENFKEMSALLMSAIQTARSLASELSPPVLYLQGLSGALEWLARWMRHTHNLEVTVTADPAADPSREDLKVLLFQSVRELLFNVVKHAGVLQASVEMIYRQGRTCIEVIDRGRGFDTEEFQRRLPAVEGGFGLFTIRERLGLMGGRFDIVRAERGGTIATIELPLEPARMDKLHAADPAVAPCMADQKARPHQPGDKIRVLLVDDHAMVRKGLSMILSAQKDIEIAGEAGDGHKAVELARKINPDVILMDINMPVMNGLEATRQICAEMPGICIIGLSMHEAEDQAQAIRRAGAVDYFSKSGSAGGLLQAIRRSACGFQENPISA